MKTSNQEYVTLRHATLGDKMLIYNWRNNPFLIRLGTSGNIITYEEHSKWFDSTINSEKINLYIINFKKIPVGQVRFDRINGDKFAISIYLIEEFTAKGIGLPALEKGIQMMKEENNINETEYLAFIKKENKISKKVFLKAGFKEMESYPLCPEKHITMKLVC